MLKLKELLKIQKQFGDSISYRPTGYQYAFALNIEIAELLNLLPWKWWKKNNTLDKTKILEELADVLAFWLSWYNLYFERDSILTLLPAETAIDREIELLEANVEIGIKQTLENPNPIDIATISFTDNFKLVQLTVSGRHLGLLIGLCMIHTHATIDEVIAAYKNKMEVNWSRQKNNY